MPEIYIPEYDKTVRVNDGLSDAEIDGIVNNEIIPELEAERKSVTPAKLVKRAALGVAEGATAGQLDVLAGATRTLARSAETYVPGSWGNWGDMAQAVKQKQAADLRTLADNAGSLAAAIHEDFQKQGETVGGGRVGAISQSVATNVPMLPYMMAAGYAGGLPGAAVAAGLQQYTSSFESNVQSGVSEDAAAGPAVVSGMITGIVTGLFGKTGLEKFLSKKLIPAGAGAKLREMAIQMGMEAAEEVTDESLQVVLDKVTFQPDMTAEQAVDRFVTAAVGGGLFGAVGGGVAEQAKNNSTLESVGLGDLNIAVADIPDKRQRRYAKAEVDRIAKDAEKNPQKYKDATELMGFLQSRGIKPEDITAENLQAGVRAFNERHGVKSEPEVKPEGEPGKAEETSTEGDTKSLPEPQTGEQNAEPSVVETGLTEYYNDNLGDQEGGPEGFSKRVSDAANVLGEIQGLGQIIQAGNNQGITDVSIHGKLNPTRYFMPTLLEGWRRRYATKEAGLTQESYDLLLKKNGFIQSQLEKAGKSATRLRNAIKSVFGAKIEDLDGSVINTINTALGRAEDKATRNNALESLPQELRGPITRMRRHVDALSRVMLREGLADTELAPVIAANLGTYLTRSYRVFDDSQWTYDNVPPDVRNEAVKWVIKDMGLSPNEADTYIRNLFADWKSKGLGAFLQPRKLGSRDISLLKRRKDIPVALRELMGEYKDPFTNYARSIAKMSHYVANNQFLNKVKREGLENGWLFEPDKAPVGFNTRIVSEGDPTLAPLEGLRTSEFMASVFRDYANQGKQVSGTGWKAYLWLNMISKGAKTVGSVMTQMRNMLGQAPFMLHGGYWKSPINTVKLLHTLATDKGKWDGYIKTLARVGLRNESVHAGELRDYMRGWTSQQGKITPLDYDLDSKLKHAAKLAWDKGTIPFKVAARIYQLSDEFGKAIAFPQELERVQRQHPEMPITEQQALAGKNIRDVIPTYSNIPKWVQFAFRDMPIVGPFVSFQYETWRTVGHNLRLAVQDARNGDMRSASERVTGSLLTHAVFGSGLAILSQLWKGVDRDDEKDIRQVLAPWEKNSTLFIFDRDKGKVSFVDVSNLNPYSPVTDAVMTIAGQRQEDVGLKAALQGFGTSLEAWISPAPLFKAIMEASVGRTWDDREIYNPLESWNSRFAKGAAHIAKAFEPGTMQRFREKTIPALLGEPQVKESVAQQLASEFSGIKTRTVDFEQSLGYAVRRFKLDERTAGSIFSRGLQSEIPMEASQIARQYRLKEGARYQVWRELYQNIKAAENQGVPTQKIEEALFNAKLGKETIGYLLDGTYIPKFPSKDLIQGMAAVGKEIPPEVEQVYEEFVGRSLDK